MSSRRLQIAALAALFAVAACSSDKNPTGPGGSDGNYYGVFGASDGISSMGGTLLIVIAGSTASGTLTPSSASGIGLTGTYASSGGAVSLSGGGHSLNGVLNSGRIGGSYSGPGGNGSFGTTRGDSPSAVTLFCGSYTGDSDGVWNLARSANALTGAYADDGGGSGVLTGTVNGSTISITFSGGSAAGSLSGSNMTGTWTAGADGGTWMGQTPC
jgi:hypothetical protein